MRLRDRLNKIYGCSSAPSELRSRLERLDARRTSQSLADYLGGYWKQRDRGRLLRVDRSWSGGHCHGDFKLEEIFKAPGHLVSLLAGDELFDDFDPARALFLDTETTGLAGGAGTCVFLVGVGFFRAGEFQICQLFLPGYDSEGAFLEELCDLVLGESRFRYLISFNGKGYDLNLLENRFVLQRLERPFRGFGHLDLLYPSRLLWRGCFRDCALQTLEQGLLGVRRAGDIPSALIPRVYFQFLHSGRFEAFDRVFEHNRTDLLTLVSLVTLATRLIENPDENLHVDVLTAARVHQLRANYPKAEELLENARETAAPGEPQTRQLLLQLAFVKKKLGKNEEALPCFLKVIDEPGGPVEAFTEAAKILEHDCGDFEAALRTVEDALRLYPSPDLRHRRYRLLCRLEGRRWY